MNEITGNTRVYGILADPIHHVKTPQVMNALFTEIGHDGVLVPLHVAPEGLEDAVRGLRQIQSLSGIIVTVPHKTVIPALCDDLTDQARMVGAVNCIRRDADGKLTGAILDGIGFVEGLRGAGHDPEGMKVILAGAGGAASAIAFALADAGIAALTIANRTEARARDLADAVGRVYPKLVLSTDASAVAGADLVVNATSLGMREGDALPLDISQLHKGQLVAEAIMEPAVTPLLAAAEKAGARTHPGLPMLQSQARLMADFMGAL
ncbi:shikimate dehydrogenase [Pseudorhodobacter turbinis]|uniref:shikimate dehydrogenase (NADP(+)) n=1 Tax=Pseudorhodobacter turbinis TaxID=2500533 RepID=A0A4P8EEX6_9RHOB|nr:shikimate dehydrogenase [Pseudorhodobacter turbinis]QCO55388.1 shikimate dehydrogenase [Pseudorhodobacter turbinis]